MKRTSPALRSAEGAEGAFPPASPVAVEEDVLSSAMGGAADRSRRASAATTASSGSGTGGPTGTVFSGIINISNTILGSGMLAMPYAIASVGLAFGLAMVLFSGLAAAFGLWLLTHVARHLPGSESRGGRRNASSFFALSEITYPHAAVYFDAAIAVKCFGVASSYLVVIGDLMPEVVAGLFGESVRVGVLGSRAFWISVAMVPIVPLSFARRLDSLRHTSMVALAAVVYLVFIVVYFFVSPEYPITPGEIGFVKFSPAFFKSLPIFVFAFTCHQNIFAVYNEIGDNSQSNLNVVVSTSVSSALIIYYVIGSLGYIMYGDSVAGNIIKMYPVIPLVTYGRLALALLFVFSFPIQAHPCRNSLTKIAYYIRKQRAAARAEAEAAGERAPLIIPVSPSYASIEQDDPRAFPSTTTGPASPNTPRTRQSTAISVPPVPPPATTGFGDAALHLTLTTAIVSLAFLVAMTVQSLDRVLAVVGATGSTTICYILPGLFYYKLYADRPWTWVKVGAVGMTGTGVVIMVCCLLMQAAHA
ncbi:hypothetical protein H9P43_007965 [Blastocladiella emersonii ATCC 22665]|nr:hypothetical protein H9P43_007965 [Blastocladiella emersonii ATCC 22665]